MDDNSSFAEWEKTGRLNFQGWLHDEAVHLSRLLLETQKFLGLQGQIVEIGVWKGLYLSSLIHFAKDRFFLGIDIWLSEDMQEIEKSIRRVYPGVNLQLIRANSFDLQSSDDFIARELDKVHFVSVDGDHSYEGAYHDLIFAAKILSPGGIIAMDDFLNPGCLGTTQATIEVLMDLKLEPIAYITNKLFITTEGWSEIYRQRISIKLQTDSSYLGMQITSGLEDLTTFIGHKKLYSFHN